GDANQSQASSTSKPENSALELNAQQLPDFKLTSPDGRELSISSFSDKPLLIVEWASWCPDCRNQLPIIQKMYEKYGNQVHFVLINLIEPDKETAETADRYISQG
ncbi:TlpA family protein disulfide reductase, partial [Escherichia coli]|uniref:TlpA family protein disulfide reductase n=2 Tax=Bacteria TaxID=2 RepID=UPI002093C8A0